MYPYNTDWITKKIMAASIVIEIKGNYLLVLGFYQEQIHYRIWMTYIQPRLDIVNLDIVKSLFM